MTNPQTSKADQFERFSDMCVEYAHRASAEQRSILLHLANLWLELAVANRDPSHMKATNDC